MVVSKQLVYLKSFQKISQVEAEILLFFFGGGGGVVSARHH